MSSNPVTPVAGPRPGHEPRSISVLLPRLLTGDPSREKEEAVRVLWERFSRRLTALARSRLGPNPRKPVDGEDVALKAFYDFVKLVGRPDARTRFPHLENRLQLWRVLARITVWEALDCVKPAGSPDNDGEEPLDHVPGRDPEPHFALAVHEAVEHLIGLLHGRDPGQTERLRRLAQLKMHGCTNADAARQLGCCVAQVELLLRYIRATWREHDPRPPSRRSHSEG